MLNEYSEKKIRLFRSVEGDFLRDKQYSLRKLIDNDKKTIEFFHDIRKRNDKVYNYNMK